MFPTPARRRLAIASRAALIAALAITVFAPSANATTSASAAESLIIGWVNSARSARGLVPLRSDSDLVSISGLRASRMASANSMSHSIGGNLPSQLNAYRVPWYRYGETIAWSSARWSVDSARAVFNAWMNSSPHRAMLLSNRFNYIGVGLAYRSSNRRTFSSAVFAETSDHTRAVARVTRGSRSGDDVSWSWSGYDPLLQTHTAGLRDYDVQYRIGAGTWVLLRDNTRGTSISLPNRYGGRSYSVRVRATDRRGNVGAWSSESRIWVP